MSPSTASHRPASSRHPGLRVAARAGGALRVLRVLLCVVPLAWVLGGGCTFVYKSGDHDDDDDKPDDDGTTVVVTSAASADDSGPGLDPELFRMDGEAVLSPTRLWQPEQIGEAELAAFAAGVLAVNEERLNLPEPASALQYLDTRVADGVAKVRFGGSPEGTGPVVSANFDATGGLVSVERELR
jgi:hypothetical protein